MIMGKYDVEDRKALVSIRGIAELSKENKSQKLDTSDGSCW